MLCPTKKNGLYGKKKILGFVMEILGYGELVEVISPSELRTQVSDRLRQAVEKYK